MTKSPNLAPERENSDASHTTTPKPPKRPPKVTTTVGKQQDTRVNNPYLIKKSKVHIENRFTDITNFLSIVTDYVNILVRHDDSHKNQPWYIL